MKYTIDASWEKVLSQEYEKPYWQALMSFVKEEYRTKACCPEEKNIFRALQVTPFETVKVVILGQDPYHTCQNIEGTNVSQCVAMGLSFSLPHGVRIQPSLKNIFKELYQDTGIMRTKTDLSDWAEQGVLLLNSVLSVEAQKPASHAGKGWEYLSKRILMELSYQRKNIVFIFWGQQAAAHIPLIDTTKHAIITSAHPSPFSAYRGFFGSRPFSRCNEFLKKSQQKGIHW